MINKIKDFINKQQFNINNKIVVATSGGVDSTTLLYILNKLGYDVILAHVNHNKREASIMEEKKMREFASNLNIPIEVLDYHFSGNGNFHDESHHARYNFFRSVCDKYNTNIIATAHHLDDQIETILIKLMEGSNLYGYGGISTCNNDGSYRIIRPLLCTYKEEIYKFANDNNIIYFEDSSNYEDDFLRNRLRHHIIPLLKEECSDLYDKALRYSLLLHESFDYIRQDSIKYLNDNNDTINVKSFEILDIALKKDIISLLLEKNNIRRNTNIINDILDLLSSNSGNKELKLEDNYRLLRSYDTLTLKKDIKLSKPNSLTLDLDETIEYGNYKFYFSKNVPSKDVKYIKLCYNKLVLPLTIRSKENGDSILLENGSKKVSRVFIDNKVSKEERDYIPIILDGNNNILWIYNMLKSDIVYKQKSDGDIYLICEVI